MTIKNEYWLVVSPDGSEQRFRHEPENFKSLHVEVLVIDVVVVEQTRTRNIQDWAGAFGTVTSVRPKGGGWQLHDDTSDNYTVWRRRAA
jgi:hypothetical protein